MSKRQNSGSSSTAQKSKKQKTNHINILLGAPSADDHRLPSDSNPSSSALSTRSLKQSSPPALTTLCIRIFSAHFPEFSDDAHWESTRKWLEIIPESILPRLFALLKKQHPRLLSHAVITTYFLRGLSVSLNGELVGVTSFTLSAIPRVMGSKLRILELSDFSKFSDKDYSSMISRLPALETLILRNCLKVGPLTVEAIAKTCNKLKTVNLSFTGVTTLSILSLIKACPDLEVLKIAGIQNLANATAPKIFSWASSDNQLGGKIPLSRLKSLKLRHNTVSDVAILPFLQCCPALERVDVSFTLLKHIPELPTVPPIEKLSLTSTFISSKELIEIVSRLPRLKILNIGAMGVKPGSSTAIMNSTAMTLTDDALRHLTDALQNCPLLETINLVQNSKLGTTRRHDSALAYFIRHIGRRCQYVNLSGIAVRSEDLMGLTAEDPGQKASVLKSLILNKTLIDDDVAPWISSCGDPEVLEVAETRIAADGLFHIIDFCHRLARLNLTGCRGVKIANRRRFFEFWEEERDTP